MRKTTMDLLLNIHRWSDGSLYGYNQWDTAEGYPYLLNLGWYCVYQKTKDNNGITFSSYANYRDW